MITKISIVAVAGSTVAYFDLGYGFLVIILGLNFILFLELWHYKKKKKPPGKPLS